MGVVLIKSGDGYNVRIIYFMNEIVAGLDVYKRQSLNSFSVFRVSPCMMISPEQYIDGLEWRLSLIHI